jgi:hypothetical protein
MVCFEIVEQGKSTLPVPMCAANVCPTSAVFVDSPMNEGVAYSEMASAVPLPTAAKRHFPVEILFEKKECTASLDEKNIQSKRFTST